MSMVVYQKSVREPQKTYFGTIEKSTETHLTLALRNMIPGSKAKQEYRTFKRELIVKFEE